MGFRSGHFELVPKVMAASEGKNNGGQSGAAISSEDTLDRRRDDVTFCYGTRALAT